MDKDKFSPLGVALREENFKAAYKLLKCPRLDTRQGAGLFCSMLHQAIAKLEVFVVEKLIERCEIDINVKEGNTGDTPLHLLMSVFPKNTTNSKYILELLI